MYAPSENVNNSAPILIENQQPQHDHAYISQPVGETREAPQDHTLVDFEPYPGYTTEGHAFPGAPMPNPPGGPQYQSPPRPLHFAIGGRPSIVLEKDRIEYMEERLRAIEGRGNYALLTWKNCAWYLTWLFL